MAVKYIPYYPDPVEGQAILDNFARTRRVLKYRDNDRIVETIRRGMPLYEMKLQERVGENKDGNLIIRGECVSACAYLKEQGIQVDLVYIDPPFASGAVYAKKIYIRRNPNVAKVIAAAENDLSDDEFRTFEDTMYGDVWNKERYLNWMYENLMAIKGVMSDTASIYVHLDYHVGHYVKVLMDEIFSDENFRNEITWKRKQGNLGQTKQFGVVTDTILFYSKSPDYFFETPLIKEGQEEYLKRFKATPYN
jgi:adenine-specific DNA-methyltransferase